MITNPTPESAEAMEAKTLKVPPVERSGSSTEHGIPEGGLAGAVLTKKSNEDYDVEWTRTLPVSVRAANIPMVRYDADKFDSTESGMTNLSNFIADYVTVASLSYKIATPLRDEIDTLINANPFAEIITDEYNSLKITGLFSEGTEGYYVVDVRMTADIILYNSNSDVMYHKQCESFALNQSLYIGDGLDGNLHILNGFFKPTEENPSIVGGAPNHISNIASAQCSISLSVKLTPQTTLPSGATANLRLDTSDTTNFRALIDINAYEEGAILLK